MVSRLEVGSAKFEDAKGSTLANAFEMNNAVHVTRAIALVRRDNERGSLLCCKSKKRLRKTAMMKRICREVSKLAETVDEDPRRFDVANCFPDLGGDGFAFDLGRRKDIVDFRLTKCFRRWCQIQNMNTVDVETNGCRVGAYVIFGLAECDQQRVFASGSASGKEVHTESGLACSRRTMYQIGALGNQSTEKDPVQTRNS